MISSDQCALITFCLAVLFHVYPAGQVLPEQLIEMQLELKSFEFDDQLMDRIIKSSERIKKTIEEDPNRLRRMNIGLGGPLKIFHFKPRAVKKNSFFRNQTTVTVFMGLVLAVGAYYAFKHQDSLSASYLMHSFKRLISAKVQS